jgi:hypothetical protein
MAKPQKTAQHEDPFADPKPADAAPDPYVEAQRNALITLEPTKPPALVYDEDDLGAGFEDFGSEDVLVPFIAILQKGSPQVEDDNPKQIAGAKAGMFMNTATGELFDGKTTGIKVIPVHRTRQFIEWIPKDEGGGLVKVYAPDAPEVLAVLGKDRQYGKLKIGDGNDLVETFSVFALLVKDDGDYDRVVISFASSQIGVYKRWMMKAQSIKVTTADGRKRVPPMFSHLYTLTTIFTQKKENTWYKFNTDTQEPVALAPDSELYVAARNFRALVTNGKVTANYESSGADVPDGEGGIGSGDVDM